MKGVQFFVPGDPIAKGSMKAFVVKGRAVITNDNPKTKVWQGKVKSFAENIMAGKDPWEGPMEIKMTFSLERPKYHSNTKGLRADAPTRPHVQPDWDKLSRCVCDALTGVCYVDDAQVVSAIVDKTYGQPGVFIRIGPWSQAVGEGI